MRGVVMYGPGDVRGEDREDPRIIEPTDAIIRLTATCICGSDLWPYRGAEPVDHQVMGHRTSESVKKTAPRAATGRAGALLSGPSGPRTTPARSAGPGTRRTACTAS